MKNNMKKYYERPRIFKAGDRVVVEGKLSIANMTGTIIYARNGHCWVEFDKNLPDLRREFPTGCPQERWCSVPDCYLIPFVKD